jgi:hypothetical protein
MSEPSPGDPPVLHLAPESIEALAVRLVQLLEPEPVGRQGRERISAAEVARTWGVGRRWVYDHAVELGARRLGSGPRPRLRFDPDEVAERLGSPDDERRSETIAGDACADSLSPRSRAIVAGQRRRRPGRRANAPRPGAERAAR